MGIEQNVFQAFPFGVVKNRWKLGTVEKGTIVGNKFVAPETYMDVIISEDYKEKSATEDIAQEKTDTLIYAKPEQLPTDNLQAYQGDYLWYDTKNDLYYAIIRCSAGFNQQNGKMEHVEFIVRPVAAEDVLEED